MPRPEWSNQEVVAVRRLLMKYGPARMVRLIGEQFHERANYHETQQNDNLGKSLRRVAERLDGLANSPVIERAHYL